MASCWLKFLLPLYGVIGFTQAASAAGVAHVMVTMPPLLPLVEEVMRGTGKPDLLFSGNQDPHTVQLTPSQARKLALSNVIIVADRGMNPSLNAAILKRAKKDAVMIALTELEGADPLLYREGNPFTSLAETSGTHKEDAHPEDTGHDHAHHPNDGADPHIWLDPIRMAAIMPSLAKKLGEIAPEYAATYALNAQRISAHLKETVHPALEAKWKSAKPSLARDIIPYVTYHDAYQYFDTRYGIDNKGFLTQRTEEYLGAASMKSILDASNATKIRCIIAESHNPLAKRIALRSEAKIILLSPEKIYASKDVPTSAWAKNDYDRLLSKIMHVFVGCVEGKAK